MRLCDKDIITALDEGLISIHPHPDEQAISGISVDLRLGNSFRVFNDHQAPYVDLSAPPQELASTLERVMSKEIVLEEGGAFFLHPGELALAVTKESVSLTAGIAGWLDGRSSLARLGLMVHVTAHRIDPGWHGKIVLEFFNSGKLPLALRPDMLIGAISFERISGECVRPYNKRHNAKYQDQDKAIPMRVHRPQSL